MVARDQHQPASSRATATLATSGFLPRSVKLRQRLCRRRSICSMPHRRFGRRRRHGSQPRASAHACSLCKMLMASGLAVPSSRRYDFAGAERSEGGQPWTATTRTLNTLREWGLDASAWRERRTAHIAAVSRTTLRPRCRTSRRQRLRGAVPGDAWHRLARAPTATSPSRTDVEHFGVVRWRVGRGQDLSVYPDLEGAVMADGSHAFYYPPNIFVLYLQWCTATAVPARSRVRSEHVPALAVDRPIRPAAASARSIRCRVP
jgi:hypothetical protein